MSGVTRRTVTRRVCSFSANERRVGWELVIESWPGRSRSSTGAYNDLFQFTLTEPMRTEIGGLPGRRLPSFARRAVVNMTPDMTIDDIRAPSTPPEPA